MFMESAAMERKTISITGKRQVTIPQKFFEALDFGKEAECVLQNNAIVIRPIRNNAGGEFAELILAELIAENYTGNELLAKFKERQKAVRPAIEKLLDIAGAAARGEGDFSTYEDIFGAEG